MSDIRAMGSYSIPESGKQRMVYYFILTKDNKPMYVDCNQMEVALREVEKGGQAWEVQEIWHPVEPHDEL